MGLSLEDLLKPEASNSALKGLLHVIDTVQASQSNHGPDHASDDQSDDEFHADSCHMYEDHELSDVEPVAEEDLPNHASASSRKCHSCHMYQRSHMYQKFHMYQNHLSHHVHHQPHSLKQPPHVHPHHRQLHVRHHHQQLPLHVQKLSHHRHHRHAQNQFQNQAQNQFQNRVQSLNQ